MSASSVNLDALSRGERSVLIPRPASRWRTRVLLPVSVLTLFGGLLAYSARDALLPARSVRVVPTVSRELAAGSSASIVAGAPGWIEPDPYPMYVSSLTDGVVREVLVLESQPVKAGDVVARLVDDEARLALQRAEAEVQHHDAEREIAAAILKAAEARWANPIEPTRSLQVAENMLAENKGELARLASELAVESARTTELEEQLKREVMASDAHAIAEWQKVQTELKLKTQRATQEMSKARRPILEAKVRQQEAEVLAAGDRLRLRIDEIRELEEARAGKTKAGFIYREACIDRDSAELRLKRMEVRAPVDGVIMALLTQPGGLLMLNTNMPNASHAVKLYNPKLLQVRVDVPLADAAKISSGQEAEIVVDILRGRKFKGKITRVSHEADLQKNTLQMKVAITDPAPELKPEMLARVQFLSPASTVLTTAERIFAPENLILKNGTQAQAWIVDKAKGRAMLRNVTLGGARIDNWIEVTQGLQPGDAVIADSAGLKEGERVKIVADTGAAPDGGATHGSH